MLDTFDQFSAVLKQLESLLSKFGGFKIVQLTFVIYL